MKTITQSSRGCTLKFRTPSDAVEFDKLTGPGQCNDNATAQVIYRCLLPKAWRALLEQAPTLFGIARPTMTETDDKGEITESGVDDKAYINAIKAEVSTADIQTAIQNIIDSWGDTFDISKAGRTKKPAAMFYTKAEQIAAKVAANGGDWTKFLANSAAQGGVTALEFDPEGNVDIDSLAKRIEEVASALDMA